MSKSIITLSIALAVSLILCAVVTYALIDRSISHSYLELSYETERKSVEALQKLIAVEWSNMPAFRHLYTLQKEQAGGSKKALKLKGSSKPKNGYEVVPTAEAELLVDYLLSLKKDAPIPGTIVTEAPAKK